jgi:hypothetical protein
MLEWVTVDLLMRVIALLLIEAVVLMMLVLPMLVWSVWNDIRR